MACSPYFKQMVDDIDDDTKHYKPPSYEKLCIILVEKEKAQLCIVLVEKEKATTHLEKMMIPLKALQNGCWFRCGGDHPLFYIIVSFVSCSSQEKNTIFLKD